MLVTLPLRGVDKHGSGHFEAPRGERKHKGIDLACWPGGELLSPVKGVCTKLGYPYGDDLSFRYVEITSEDLRHRFFYVEPDPSLAHGRHVNLGDPLGTGQDLRGRYEGITPHIHYEIFDLNGLPIDPADFL